MEIKGDFIFEDIVLKGNKTRYQAGEDVSGVIKFAVNGAAIGANIKISLICVSEVEWAEDPNSFAYLATLICQDKIYLIKETFALPKQSSLPIGEHQVPFTFKLPEKGIPSSFVGSYGSIKYFIEVENQGPGGHDGLKFGLYEFKVDAPSHQNLSLPIGCSKEKDFGLLSLASGKLFLHAGFKKKGCAPGESIELHVRVNNESSVDVTPRATLYQFQIYKCEQADKALQIPITNAIIGKKVEKHQNLAETLFIPIPKDTPLTIKSPLISVKYFVHVTLDIPHAFDIHVNVPVVIANTEPNLEFPSFISIK